jgi:hypothetical protein
MNAKPSKLLGVFNFQLVLALRTFQTEQFMMLNDSEPAISTTNI